MKLRKVVTVAAFGLLAFGFILKDAGATTSSSSSPYDVLVKFDTSAIAQEDIDNSPQIREWVDRMNQMVHFEGTGNLPDDLKKVNDNLQDFANYTIPSWSGESDYFIDFRERDGVYSGGSLISKPEDCDEYQVYEFSVIKRENDTI